MSTFIHDVDLGPKPDDRERHRIISNGRKDPILLTVLHYLRDEAAARLVDATDALRNGQEKPAHMEMGAHDWLVQVFKKLDQLRNTPLEIEPTA
jgi:hypothetical protein